MRMTADALCVEHITDRVSNPFGMRPPCPHECEGSDRRAVFGYGDVNAEFHVIGDHPGVHGGSQTGIPFTGHPAGERVLDVLEATGFVSNRAELTLSNCYLSYIHLCCVPEGETPPAESYAACEPFFDAELRAVCADVLVPIGPRPTRRVLREYTAHDLDDPLDMEELHGTQLRGRGFLVVPLLDPTTWTARTKDAAEQALEAVLAIDYYQMVDLGRFIPGGDPYFVR